MRADKDKDEYYQSVDAKLDRKNSCETPVVNTKLLNGHRKVSSPCISMTKIDLSPSSSSHQQNIKSMSLVRQLSHQLTSST